MGGWENVGSEGKVCRILSLDVLSAPYKGLLCFFVTVMVAVREARG